MMTEQELCELIMQDNEALRTSCSGLQAEGKTFPLPAFDEDVERSSPEDVEPIFMLASIAQLTLEQLRAWWAMKRGGRD